MAGKQSLIPVERIERAIMLIRGHKVMLDTDLAALYRVETRVLVQGVKRNLDPFPEDFMFQLTKAEFKLLRSQSVTSRSRAGMNPAPTTQSRILDRSAGSALNPLRYILPTIYYIPQGFRGQISQG